MKYRAEIDGLRALAVVPVVLFHAGFEIFSGGYVGVDIFFVISGYLITTIIIDDIESNRFSLINFYERRARRILPALFLVVLVCIPFAWIWMLPHQMEDFSLSLIAVSAFVSNVLFFWESGYFEPAAEEKPLLHTWSLAVEEQYYILFPIFIFLAWRVGKNRVFWTIVVIAAVSLSLSEWGWRNSPTANFYLAPTRTWELLSGSIAAFIVNKHGPQKNDFLSLIGFAAIVFSIFTYDDTTPFPSIYALVPVTGAVLLVLFASKGTIAAKLLSIKVFVSVGLISYSTYLWHQPLFAFAKIRLPDEPGYTLLLALSLMALALGWLSWRYVERPFRKKVFKTRSILIFSLLGLVFFVGIGVVGLKNKGYPGRFNELDFSLITKSPRNYGQYVATEFNNHRLIPFTNNKYKVLVVGDSYAQDVFNSLIENANMKKVSLSSHAIRNACGIVFSDQVDESLIQGGLQKYCRSQSRFEGDKIIQILKEADIVLLASHWRKWVVDLLPNTKQRLYDLGVKKIIIIGNKNFGKISIPNYLGLTNDERLKIYNSVTDKHIKVNNQMRSHVADFFDVQKIFCQSEIMCPVFTPDGKLISYDGGHLTSDGAKLFGKSILNYEPLSEIPKQE